MTSETALATINHKFQYYLEEGTILPTQATDGSVGYDLYAKKDYVIEAGGRVVVGTGIRLKMPKGVHPQVCSRSGLALKNGVFVINAPGIIDPDFRGEIGVILANIGDKDFEIKQGAKIAQLVFAINVYVDFSFGTQLESPDDFIPTERGEAGFGSSG